MKILNERTGRNVRINGRIGRRIIEKRRCQAKRSVLCNSHIRNIVIRFLVFKSFREYISFKKNEFYYTTSRRRNIDLFYKKSMFITRIDTHLSFNEIHLYYIEFMKKNIRYNMYDNKDALVQKNKRFCRAMNRLFRERNSPYIFTCFSKYILALNNSIKHEDTKHRHNLNRYRQALFNRSFSRHITYYW